MRRYALRAVEDIWNGLVAGLRALFGDPWAVATLVGAGILMWQLLWQLASH